MLVSLDVVGDFQSRFIVKAWVPDVASEDDAESILQETVCALRHRGADYGLFLSSDDIDTIGVEHFVDGTEFILGWRPQICDVMVSLVGGPLHGSRVYCPDILGTLEYLVEDKIEQYRLSGWDDASHRWQFEFEAPTPLV